MVTNITHTQTDRRGQTMKRAQNFFMINDNIVRIGISHRIKHIICLTNQTQTFWFLQCEQNYLQESTQVRVGKGGTHVCV